MKKLQCSNKNPRPSTKDKETSLIPSVAVIKKMYYEISVSNNGQASNWARTTGPKKRNTCSSQSKAMPKQASWRSKAKQRNGMERNKTERNESNILLGHPIRMSVKCVCTNCVLQNRRTVVIRSLRCVEFRSFWPIRSDFMEACIICWIFFFSVESLIKFWTSIVN